MYCKKCGAEIPENSVYCPVCGEKVENDEESNEDDFSSIHIIDFEDKKLKPITIVAFVLAFVVPIAGFILGIVGSSKDYNKRNNWFCIIAIAISIVVFIFNMIFGYRIKNYILNWFN